MLFTEEKQAWEALRLPKHKNKRRKFSRTFKKMFPQGHETSLRPLLEYLMTPEGKERAGTVEGAAFLKQFHPDAIPLLLEYGQDYLPLYWKKPPKIEPEVGSCSLNSYRLMTLYNRGEKEQWLPRAPDEAKECVYVEGLVTGVVAFPMLHAWNAWELAGTTANDWTHYAGCHWNRYFGIPFTQEEYCRAMVLCRKITSAPLLLDITSYPCVKDFLRESLQARRGSTTTKAA